MTNETDENGFTEKEQDEVVALMERYEDVLAEILNDLSAKYSCRADLKGRDLGPLTFLAREHPTTGRRDLPYMAFWWSLLFELRARDTQRIDMNHDDDLAPDAVPDVSLHTHVHTERDGREGLTPAGPTVAPEISGTALEPSGTSTDGPQSTHDRGDHDDDVDLRA